MLVVDYTTGDHEDVVITLPHDPVPHLPGSVCQLRFWKAPFWNKTLFGRTAKGHIDRGTSPTNFSFQVTGTREELLEFVKPFVVNLKMSTNRSLDGSLFDVWDRVGYYGDVKPKSS